MVLSTSCWINTCKLSEGRGTAAAKDQHDDNPIEKEDSAALGYADGKGSNNPCPAVAYVPSTADDLESPERAFGQLSETEEFQIGRFHDALHWFSPT